MLIQTKLPTIGFAAIFWGLVAFPACAQSLQERVSTCFDCHGEKGQSQRPEVPSLGAQRKNITLRKMRFLRNKITSSIECFSLSDTALD
jgi:cytochrome c553